jgi:sulfonate dioxygenase
VATSTTWLVSYKVPCNVSHTTVVYTDKNARPDPYAFSRAELFHSDVTYEVQPPGPTILRLLTTPEVGNDTLWSSGTALYSSLSKSYQTYLESLSAIHTGHNQAASRVGTIAIPKRAPIETVHPVVRVHPFTGHKAIFVNPGFVTRIVGVPKAESDNTLAFLRDGFAQQTDATTRWRWEAGDVAIWENR